MAVNFENIYAKGNDNYKASPGSAVYGEYAHKIKMFISEESDNWEKNKDITKKLFVIEKSNAAGEAIVGESNFGIFDDVGEGAEAPATTVKPMYDKYITHHEFKKSFTVTKTMMEDSKNGIASEAKLRARNFARAYGMTRNKLAAAALYNGRLASMTFAGASYDIATADQKPLFSTAHTFANISGTQSNYFEADLSTSEKVENALTAVAVQMRNFKDENGEALGYVPNVIVLPGNRGKLETLVKKVVGTERTAGTNNNDIGLQYNNWDIVIMTDWQADEDVFIVMSTDARDALMGSVLYDRVPLTVRYDVEHLTENQVWVGRARMGVGHPSWKHVAMVTGDTSKEATALSL